jgi:hypothetical protein
MPKIGLHAHVAMMAVMSSGPMVHIARITIRDLDAALERELPMRAAHRNRSMEEEAGDILRMVLTEETAAVENLADT